MVTTIKIEADNLRETKRLTHITVEYAGPSESGKTEIWLVVALLGSIVLGQIRWHGPWRGYAFFPRDNTLYEHQCLRDVAEFIETANLMHRARRTAQKVRDQA